MEYFNQSNKKVKTESYNRIYNCKGKLQFVKVWIKREVKVE
jgi:hypothetical protein